jgi:GxxExxY protein
MDIPKSREEYDRLTSAIIKCAHKVSYKLGCGFLEKVYENALSLELRKAGIKVDQQRSIKVLYDGVVVGDYFADLLVEDVVIVELKTVKALDDTHFAQCLNYLKATEIRVCLLINFSKPLVDVRRIVNGY